DIYSLPSVVDDVRTTTAVVDTYAQASILPTASLSVRRARRSQQLRETEQDPSNVETDEIDRDKTDSALVDFMTPADGVVEIDTSDLSLEDTVTVVLAEIQRQVNADGM